MRYPFFYSYNTDVNNTVQYLRFPSKSEANGSRVMRLLRWEWNNYLEVGIDQTGFTVQEMNAYDGDVGLIPGFTGELDSPRTRVAMRYSFAGDAAAATCVGPLLLSGFYDFPEWSVIVTPWLSIALANDAVTQPITMTGRLFYDYVKMTEADAASLNVQY